jgi:hypothetical protein
MKNLHHLRAPLISQPRWNPRAYWTYSTYEICRYAENMACIAFYIGVWKTIESGVSAVSDISANPIVQVGGLQ